MKRGKTNYLYAIFPNILVILVIYLIFFGFFVIQGEEVGHMVTLADKGGRGSLANVNIN